MAYTILAQPTDGINPAYNPLRYILNSTNKYFSGFRYTVEVKDTSGNFLYKASLAPRPGDLYGEFALDRIIQNRVSWDFYPTSSFYALAAGNSYFTYNLSFGEKYNYSWNYTQVQKITTGPNIGKVRLVGSVLALFINASVIKIKHSGALHPELNGYYTVLNVGLTNVDIDLDFNIFGSANFNESGFAIKATEEKTITPNLQVLNNHTVYNAAFGYKEWIGFDFDNYDMTFVGSSQFITSCPYNFTVTESQALVFNIFKNDLEYLYLYIETSDGEEFRNELYTPEPWLGVAVGPANMDGFAVGGSLPIIKPTTTWYTVTIKDSSDNPHSETRKIFIDDRCPIYYKNVTGSTTLYFLDRQGAWGSFSFQLKSTTNISNEKRTYKTQHYYTGGTKYNYETSSQYSNTYSSKIKETIDLNTNFMSEADSLYFEELLSSPAVYIKPQGEDNYFQVEVTDTQIERKQKRNKALIRHSLKVQLTANDNINI